MERLSCCWQPRLLLLLLLVLAALGCCSRQAHLVDVAVDVGMCVVVGCVGVLIVVVVVVAVAAAVVDVDDDDVDGIWLGRFGISPHGACANHGFLPVSDRVRWIPPTARFGFRGYDWVRDFPTRPCHSRDS